MLFLLLACTPSDTPKDEPSVSTNPDTDADADTDADTDSDADSDTDADSDSDSDTDTTSTLATLNGTITWNVDFGPDSEAKGMTDCSYTRTYVGEEDTSAPWLCPECQDLFHANITLSDGQDCYDSVATSPPSPTEWIGYGNGLWYRASTSLLSERGPATRDATSLTVSQLVDSADSGGDYAFDIQGSLTIGEAAGDPNHGWNASSSYACGWPKADPPPYSGDYLATVGNTLPDGLFNDVCEDTVRIHDFKGRYLIIDISAMDCGPCQAAAGTEAEFMATMAADGIDVEVITLLAPSLNNTAGTPTTKQLQSWIDTYGITSPVLADRIWGIATVYTSVGADNFGYPSFVVVDPDLKILDVHVGFSNFDAMGAMIKADAGM